MKSVRKPLFIQVCIVLISLSVVAQQRIIEGFVTDQDGKPVVNATVAPKGFDRSVLTDENGHYVLDSVPESVLTLTCTHPEMEPASASIGLYNQVDIRMSSLGSELISEMSLEDLLNMDITTVSKSAEKISDAPGVISVLTKDEISRFGGITLKDLLERMPGLIGSTVYMTDRSTIAPRGDQVLASSSHVLLLINGRPVREALEGGIKGETYEAFPINIIERIEVIRGPGSVLYGSNAFSAVINVITERHEETSFDVTAQADIEGGYGALMKTSLNFGELNINAAARYFHKSEWETDWQFATPTGDSTVGISIPNVSTGAYMDIDYKNIRLMASYTEWDNYYFIPDYAFIFPAYGNANWKKGFVDLGYNLKATEKWTMDFNMTYTRSTFKTENWPSTNRDSYEMVGEWSNFYNPTEKLGIVFGGLFNYFKGEEWGPTPETEKFFYTDADRYSAGAYAQLNYELLSSLNLIGGLQANKVQGIDFNVVPRAGLIWYPFTKINVKAFYSQAFRAPSINEFSINFPQMQGNPDLTPEKVNTVDVGVGYQGKQINVGVNFFYSQMENLIFQNRDTTEVPAPIYWNGAEVEFMGVEFEAKYYINKELYITGSMLYQTNEDKEGNKNVTPISNMGFKAGLSYKSDKGITAGIFNIYQGKLDDSYDTELNISPGAYNLLNLYVNFELVKLFKLHIKQGISLFVQADNLFDKEIWLPTWGLLPGTSIPVNPGRSVTIGLRANF